MFHKIGTPLFFYLLNHNSWGTLQEQVYKTKIRGVREPRELIVDLWTNGISWISASSTKSFVSGERDFELAWLQEEKSLNIRCDHFSLLTFCHVLLVKRMAL